MIDRLIVNILEWAAGHADEGRYSPVAIVFHWTMAGLVFLQLGLGWWMGRLPVGGDKANAYSLHFAIGVLMLVMIVCRFGWRLLAPGPINDADKPGWATTAAKITHAIFYICLFGLPLSGWAMISATARDQELTLLGLTPWPLMPTQDLSTPVLWRMEAVAEWIHWGLVAALVALVPIHVAGALKHQFIDRDDVLHGMLPVVEKPPPKRPAWARRYRTLERALTTRARPLFQLSPPRSTARRRSS